MYGQVKGSRLRRKRSESPHVCKAQGGGHRSHNLRYVAIALWIIYFALGLGFLFAI